jgi:hypothetical protein
VDGETSGVVCGRREGDMEVGAGDGMEGCVVEVIGRECGVVGRRWRWRERGVVRRWWGGSDATRSWWGGKAV